MSDIATVISVASDSGHNFSKPMKPAITLVAGLGVKGDAHSGETVKHRSRVAKDPSQPNLRQVHLIHEELFDELAENGFSISPGQMGENLTTRGVDLLGLPQGARLHIGNDIVIEITGLRNPCAQIENHQKGLLKACLDKDENGKLIRKAGVMSVVLTGGDIHTGDMIKVVLPEGEPRALECV